MVDDVSMPPSACLPPAKSSEYTRLPTVRRNDLVSQRRHKHGNTRWRDALLTASYLYPCNINAADWQRPVLI